jgi:peroxiredoxin
MSLQDKLDAFRTNFEAGGPPFSAPEWIHEPMHRATAELIASGAASRALKVGDPAPSFTLGDPDGHSVSSADLLKQGPLVATFYRGAWCPYCNIALRTYREQLVAPLAELGVALVAISPQTADGSMTLKEKLSLDFAVLSDPGNQIAGALGILTHPSDEARAMQLEHGLDISVLNADGTTNLPMPTTAIVDADGKLAWIDIHADYTTRTEPSQILEQVRQLTVGHRL